MVDLKLNIEVARLNFHIEFQGQNLAYFGKA